MKVGDLVKYTPRHKELQDLTGVVVESCGDRLFRYDQIRVLWSDADHAEGPVWDWVSELRVVSESR